MKKETWADFIKRHFITGRVKDISLHIEKMAKEENFNQNNKTIHATVEHVLPVSTPDAPITSTRQQVRDYFRYDKETKMYRLKTNADKSVLFLNNSKKVKTSTSNGEKIEIKTLKDKSKKHNDLLKRITEYARKNGYVAEPEKNNVDLILLKNDKYTMIEVKTYENSIYLASGQILFYKFIMNKLFEDQKNLKEATLNIVGNFELPDKFSGFLETLDIHYFNEEEFKKSLN